MFRDALAQTDARVSRHLKDVLAPFGDQPVIAAMRYAVAGGKRLRAFLVLEGARLHGVPVGQAIHAAAAVELLHAYSLIHDDLPCMDNDDLRRGQPTVHIKWDRATAVLAGDALQTLAFEVLTHPGCAPEPDIRVALIAGLARASGAQGMVLGQARDIAAESSAEPLTLAEITDLQRGKTGALIGWAATSGAVMARSDTRPLQDFANALGLAFQIVDDILDVEGNLEATGKRVGKDAAAGKATFVSTLGLTGAKARAKTLAGEATAALKPYGEAAENLRQAAQFVIARNT